MSKKVTKRKLAAAQAQLDHQVSRLKDELHESDAKRRTLRTRVRHLETLVARLAEQRSSLADDTVVPTSTVPGVEDPGAADLAVETDAGARDDDDAAAESVPNQSWTVIQLRGAAKDRGLTGTSRFSKLELLDVLR